MLAPTNAGLRNSVRSSIGYVVRRSMTRKATISSRGADQAGDDRGAPVLGVAADQAEDEQEQRAGERHGAGPVDLAAARVLRDSATLRERQRDRREPDRHVDEEDRLPADGLHEHAADQRPDGDGAADRRAPEPERRAAVAALIGGGDQRERGREHERAADALQRAREVEHQRRDCAKPHSAEAAVKMPSPITKTLRRPDAVGDRAGGQQQRRERERVGVDDPLQVGEARLEVALDVGQRDVHDRDVEQQHEGRDADRDERPPLGHADDTREGPPETATPLSSSLR